LIFRRLHPWISVSIQAQSFAVSSYRKASANGEMLLALALDAKPARKRAEYQIQPRFYFQPLNDIRLIVPDKVYVLYHHFVQK